MLSTQNISAEEGNHNSQKQLSLNYNREIKRVNLVPDTVPKNALSEDNTYVIDDSTNTNKYDPANFASINEGPSKVQASLTKVQVKIFGYKT